ncbi:MAG: 6-bladed beta-propeller [Calditrichaeota bacterium]|nr:6-bladed beta-propeller [Calditrichota bacterium]
MKIILIAVLFPAIIWTQDKHLSNKPLYNNAFSVKEIVTITDDDGFYGSIDTYISEDNKIVILDRGNHRVLIYNVTGEKIFEFGNEGNGPGEFSPTFDPLATAKYLLFFGSTKLMVFDYSGKLISEIAGDFYNNITIEAKTDFIQFYYRPNKNQTLLSARYSYQGKLLNSEIRPFDDPPKYDTSTYENWFNTFEYLYKEKLAFFPFNDDFISIERSAYRLDILDLNGNKKQSVYRKFQRVKMHDSDFYQVSEEEKVGKTKEEIENLVKFYINANKKMMELSGGYRPDINRIAGSFMQKYLIVWVTSDEEDTIILDFFDKNYDFYTQVTLKG